jgi:hypothetical protein
MIINYIYKSLRLFFLSSAFPILLGIMIFIVYMVYFEPAILCDDNGYFLYELKRKLTEEIANYKIINVRFELYKELQEQDLNYSISTGKTNINREVDTQFQIEESMKGLQKYSSKIKKLEISIKNLEPNFKLPVDSTFFQIGKKGIK